MKAFNRLDELKSDPEFRGAKSVKLMRGDCHNLDTLKDDSFDCVVDTLTLHSCHSREQIANEIKRLCKPGGKIFLLERGQSYISLYNSWLQFKAAYQLMNTGSVEHLDIENIIDEQFKGLKVVHKERKNMGMTYIYIIENTPEEQEENTETDG